MRVITGLFLACVLIAFTSQVCAQQSGIVLKGRILDENGYPLPYAKISDYESRKTTLSNQRGLFYLTVPAEKVSLHISYIGYLPVDTTLNFKSTTHDTVSVSFRMVSTVKELGAITVSSQPYIRVFETTNLNILDYTFFGQHILLLVKSRENYQVRLLDQQEKILTRQNLAFKPVSFVKDCLGILHIVSEDSLYPVHFDSEVFTFPDAIPVEDYVEFIEPCVAATENFFFLKYVTNFNQTIDYISQRKADDFYQSLRKVTDPAKVNDVENYARELQVTVAPNIMGDIFDPRDVRASREKAQDQFFFDLVITNAVYAPLIRTGNAVYVFDHLADSCFVFSQNSEFIRQFSIGYHLQENWANTLLTDEAQEKIYAVHQTNGIFLLSEINLETGQLKEGTELVRHTYPQKIRIRDGWVYYLHNLDNSGFNKLYKVRLKER
ncbi:MAG: carboxypeptidase-like regulatory domain-containing protein [Bacteroidetes bacterium]|nr:carboxypeptidase-like regulatory domain-containing protein [Bacteroidota bacterium]